MEIEKIKYHLRLTLIALALLLKNIVIIGLPIYLILDAPIWGAFATTLILTEINYNHFTKDL